MRQLLLALTYLGYSLADEDCLDDFHLVPGSIPGDRSDGQIKGGVDTDEEGCAAFCNKVYEDCCSYEHSLSKNICNLNKECKPTEDQNEDFKFCVKDGAGDTDYGLKVHGSVVSSDMDNAGDSEVIVKGNIEHSNVHNYGGKDGKGLTVEGSVKASVLKTAGEHEVEVHGNIVDSDIENYKSNKGSDLSVINISKNNLIGTISRLDDEYIVSFEMMVHKHTYNPEWSNALHFTINPSLSWVYGVRTPSVFMHKSKVAHMSSAVNGNINHWVNSPPLPEKKWIPFVISQLKSGSKHKYKLMVDNKMIHHTYNNNPQSFKNVKVYASNPRDFPVDGKIRSLMVQTKGWCLNQAGKDQNPGTKGLPSGMSKDDCWMHCRKQTESKGCEYHWPTKSCAMHTQHVAGSGGDKQYVCLLLF